MYIRRTEWTSLSRPRYRNVTVWNREPTSLETLLALERPNVEHPVDLVDRERTDCRTPETTPV